MRVLIIACTLQKVNFANKLITEKQFSKALNSIGASKRATQAHALVVYYESKEDLVKLESLLKIYQGIPLKFFLGNKNYQKFTKGKNFYPF